MAKQISTAEILKMLEENEKDFVHAKIIAQERAQNYNPYPNGLNIADFYRDMFNDDWISGNVMTYPHGRIIKQSQSRFYYRGEKQIYKSSQASLYRRLNRILPYKWEVESFVAFMRIVMFLDLLLRFKHVDKFLNQTLILQDKNVGGLDILYIALAQHYGLDTALLDITSDLNTALFFACCTPTDKVNEWRPLNKCDFDKQNGCEYGVIFRKYNLGMNDLLSYYYNETKILPIGFQPFMRCHMQYGYMALMNPQMSLQNDLSFQNYYFKHDENFCKWVFERMECGEKIYPHEGLNLLYDEISYIKTATQFPCEVFEFACEEMRLNAYNIGIMKAKLKYNGYSIGGDCTYIPWWKIKEVDKLYKDFDIEETYGIKLHSRLTYTDV